MHLHSRLSHAGGDGDYSRPAQGREQQSPGTGISLKVAAMPQDVVTDLPTVSDVVRVAFCVVVYPIVHETSPLPNEEAGRVLCQPFPPITNHVVLLGLQLPQQRSPAQVKGSNSHPAILHAPDGGLLVVHEHAKVQRGERSRLRCELLVSNPLDAEGCEGQERKLDRPQPVILLKERGEASLA